MFNRFNKTKITFAFVFIYVILFEFTWITQDVFPKPSLLFDSFLSLLTDYKFASAYFTTSSILYLSLFLVILFIEIFRIPILKLLLKFPYLQNIAAPFKYFIYFFFALLFNLLFQGDLFTEIVFIFLFNLFAMFGQIEKASKNILDEYQTTAKSLKVKESKIFSNIIWKEIQPGIYSESEKIHVAAWSVILVYEFIGNTNGIGAVFNTVFLYKDFLGIVVLGIIVALTIVLVNLLISEVRKKLIFWK